MELTPTQRQQLESVINSSVIHNYNQSGSSLGAPASAPMGTSLTTNKVPTFKVDEYGSPILSQARNIGASLITAPNQPNGSVNLQKNADQLSPNPWKKVTGKDSWAGQYKADYKPASSSPPTLAQRYAYNPGSVQPAGSTLMEDQQAMREWRAKNPAQFYSKGLSVDDMQWEDIVIDDPKRKRVTDPWEGLRAPGEKRPAAKPLGLSLFGGGVPGLPGLLMSLIGGAKGGPQVQGAAMPVSTSGPANYTPTGMLHPGTGWTDSATGNDAAYMPQSWQDNPRNYNGGY